MLRARSVSSNSMCQRPRHDPILGYVVDKLPGQSPMRPLGFIHIPKTGGTAIESQVHCPDLRCGWHDATAYFWHGLGMHSVAILREPLSRFVSMFEYARVGSEKHHVGFERFANCASPGKHARDKWGHEFRTLTAFVDTLMTNGTSLKHELALSLIHI